MNGIGKAIFLWGIICLLGFGVYQFTLTDRSFPQPLPVWTALTIIGIVGTVLWVPNWAKNHTAWVWFAVGIVGMLIHWYYATQSAPVPFGPWGFWALLMALGFLATGFTWKSNFYYGVGMVNALVFLVIVFASSLLGNYQSVVLALVSGVPLMYNGLMEK